MRYYCRRVNRLVPACGLVNYLGLLPTDSIDSAFHPSRSVKSVGKANAWFFPFVDKLVGIQVKV